MICGIDPGKTGGFSLMSESGTLWEADAMPLVGGKISAVGIAELLKDYQLRTCFETVNVFIEEVYTPPTDATPRKALDDYRALFVALGQYLASVDGGYTAEEHMDALREHYQTCGAYADATMKVDGRKGLLSYAKGAGMLHMPALWGWPITEVKPSIWCREMKQGVDRSLSTKNQSIVAAQSLWPQAFSHESPVNFYPTPRCKKVSDGMVEAALIAEWGRRRLAKNLKAS